MPDRARRNSGAASRTSASNSPALGATTLGITIADASREDDPLIDANDGFTAITGYDKAEVIGENCRFLQGEETAKDPVSAMPEAIEAGERSRWNLATIERMAPSSGTGFGSLPSRTTRGQ